MSTPGTSQNYSTPELLVAALGPLPPTAQVLARLQTMLVDPNSDLSDVGKLLRLDAAMTTRVIKISNSTWFSRGSPCHTIDEAVNRIGFKEVFQVVSVAASSALVAQPLAAYGRGAIAAWRESGGRFCGGTLRGFFVAQCDGPFAEDALVLAETAAVLVGHRLEVAEVEAQPVGRDE